MSKLETGIFNVVKSCYDSKGNRLKQFDVVFISEFKCGKGYDIGEGSWIELKNLSRADTVVVSVDKYKDILFGRCEYEDVNYVPEGDLSFTFDDLCTYLTNINDLIYPNELAINLIKYSKQYENIKSEAFNDPFLEKETTLCYAFLLYGEQMIDSFGENYEELTKKALDEARLHLDDIYDSSLYSYPLLMHVLKIFEYEYNLNMIKGNEKKCDLYFDLLGIGVNQNIVDAIKEAAYHYYCGTPISDRDVDKAEPLLQRLVNEYNDMDAANTLGYIYYYYRKDNKDHYRIAYSYYSAASLAGVIEATYKCADIFEKGLLGFKNPGLSHKLLLDCYDKCVDDFFSGDFVSKFPDLCFRLGMHFKDGIGVRQNEYMARAYLLVAKKALEIRMSELDYIGDDSVLNRINKELNNIKKPTKDIIEVLPGSLLNNGLDVFYGYHNTYEDVKCTADVVDKNTLTLSVSSALYNYIIFPDLINDRTIVTNKLVLSINCKDASSLKKEIMKHSMIQFRDSTSTPELIINNKKGETCYVIRGFSLITGDIN